MSYPYLTSRTYRCGHPSEIIHVSRSPSSGRLMHTIVPRLPASVQRTMLMYSTLEKCARCARQGLPRGMDSKGWARHPATEQGVWRPGSHEGERRDWFREVLEGFRYGIDRGSEEGPVHAQYANEDEVSFIRDSRGLTGYERAERRHATYEQLVSEGLGVLPRFDFERDCEGVEEDQEPLLPSRNAQTIEGHTTEPRKAEHTAEEWTESGGHIGRLSLETRPQYYPLAHSPVTLQQSQENDEYIRSRLSPDRIIHRNAAGFFEMSPSSTPISPISPLSPPCTPNTWYLRGSSGTTRSARLPSRPMVRNTAATWHSAEARLMRSLSGKGAKRTETESCDSTPRHRAMRTLWRVVTKSGS
ncbi:uncharacterized protein EI97DRAFT_445335 [Westerdykella ornata]|uniref:Uncharacterized protein n=1 Tax=Westerdykella ornata TaxID=318751 RepID=A0A6A6J9M6_WESOR|nr:uncharacterized protein EI97DRAFT_445335 [Westerdykella ornata]KAF2272873.1 hypothetical protein EI97DRAFT_445335 [Westerdykella ornata]